MSQHVVTLRERLAQQCDLDKKGVLGVNKKCQQSGQAKNVHESRFLVAHADVLPVVQAAFQVMTCMASALVMFACITMQT